MNSIIKAIFGALPAAFAEIQQGIADAEAKGESGSQKAAALLGDLGKLISTVISVL